MMNQLILQQNFQHHAGDETLSGNLGDTVVSSDGQSNSIKNGSGNTAITNSQTSAGNVTL